MIILIAILSSIIILNQINLDEKIVRQSPNVFMFIKIWVYAN